MKFYYLNMTIAIELTLLLKPPTIINLPMSCEIPENIETESLLYTVSVTDPTNDSVTCTLVAASSIYFLQSGSTQFGEFNIYHI